MKKGHPNAVYDAHAEDWRQLERAGMDLWQWLREKTGCSQATARKNELRIVTGWAHPEKEKS